jgi:predicted ABC-type ATPase
MKRMRVFAGPNGSGKTTLVNQFIKEKSKLINPGHHINPDDLNLVNVLNFNDFGLKVDENDFRDFISQSPFYDKCDIDIKEIKVNDNRFYITNRNSYMGAMLADYLRHCYLYSKETLFSFETVLSHSSKVDFLKNAKNCGWQVYLYFVSTADSYINYSRVEERVLNGGHDVPPNKIRDRYIRSHENLFVALQHCRRAYIFDNSTQQMQLIAEKKPDNSLTLLSEDSIPAWLDEFVLSKIK